MTGLCHFHRVVEELQIQFFKIMGYWARQSFCFVFQGMVALAKIVELAKIVAIIKTVERAKIVADFGLFGVSGSCDDSGFSGDC